MAGAAEERLPLTEPLAPVSTPEDDFLRLRRLLVRARGFALALVGSNVPAERDRFIERLKASLEGEGIELRRLRLREPTDDLFGEIAALESAAGQAVAVAGFERSIPSRVEYPPALARLNRMRELFRDLPCPVLLFLPQLPLTRLAREAPDFWAWRSAVFDIGMPAAPAALIQRDPTDLDSAGYANLSAERKRGHLEVLRGLLREEEVLGEGHEAPQADLLIRISYLLQIMGEGAAALEAAKKAVDVGAKARQPGLLARASGRLADIYYRQGDFDEALRIHQEVELPIYEQLGDAGSRARTFGRIADIYYRRGELDEALRICQEEELPVYEKLGDVRERAVTLGKIAEIHFARGEFDEALRLSQEEELPVFEELGDLRERAFTLGRIADIYFVRGELDEALRIRQEEELPVYEKLGDLRSHALTLGQIADIYETRGELDEALRIRQEEELPVYEKVGDVRERAITLGQIADIFYKREEFDEALHILRHEVLPVAKKMGDLSLQERVLGKTANILAARGEFDEALRILRDQRMPIVEKLDDPDSRAHTLFTTGRVDLRRGDKNSALENFSKAYRIGMQLGRLEFICEIGVDLGQLLSGEGQVEKGRTMLLRSRAGFEKLGRPDKIRQVDEILAQLPQGEPEPSAGSADGAPGSATVSSS